MRMIRDHGDRLRPWKPDSVATRTLRRLGEDRRGLVDARTALTNQLSASLKESFPQALRWAGGLQSDQACNFLESWPTFAEVQKASKSQLIKFYRQHRHSQRWAEERVAEVRAAVPATQDEALIEVGAFLVESVVGRLRALNLSIAAYDARIAELFAAHVDASIFASLPHAGAALAPRLLAAFGDDRERFASAQDVAEFTGIAPRAAPQRQNQDCPHAHRLPQIHSSDFSRIRACLHRRILLGQSLLGSTTRQKKRQTRHPAGARLPMDPHPLPLLERLRPLRRVLLLGAAHPTRLSLRKTSRLKLTERLRCLPSAAAPRRS
jgi:hypothetical protein